ncbi:hypothetical protein HDU96_002425 [Phlyctochytrium bullatum]|nr:hypothetical protein HDU96_002425 [Phlyctochytrium bullatum]
MPRYWLAELDPVGTVYSAPAEDFVAMRISRYLAKHGEVRLRRPRQAMSSKKDSLVFAFICRLRPDLITPGTVKEMVTVGCVPFVHFLCRTDHKALDPELVARYAFNMWSQPASRDPAGDYSGSSPHIKILEAMHSKGCPIGRLQLGYLRFTSLFIAAQLGGYEMCKLLVRSGADLKKTHEHSQPPLLTTLPNPNHSTMHGKGATKPRKGAAQVVRFLLENGAAADVAGEADGAMLIHRAAWHGAWDICIELLERNVNVNAVDRAGRTPIHFLASSPSPEDADALAAVVETFLVLVRHGADLTRRTEIDYQTPLQIAGKAGNHVVAALLTAYLETPHLPFAAGTAAVADKTRQPVLALPGMSEGSMEGADGGTGVVYTTCCPLDGKMGAGRTRISQTRFPLVLEGATELVSSK